MLLVDSTIWIDYFNGLVSAETDYLDQVIGHESILVGDLILAEVLQGYRSEVDFEQARQALIRFDLVSLISPALAVQSARNYRYLRQQGLTVRKTIDCLIATYCIENLIPLLHNDRDYDAFEQHLRLHVIHP